jgi:hypothetical protein
MRMSFNKTGHQGAAPRFDDQSTIGREALWRPRDRLDPGAFDKYVGGKSGSAAAVPDTGAAKENWLHDTNLPAN